MHLLTTYINAPRPTTEVIWDLAMLFFVLAAVYFACIFYIRHRLKLIANDRAVRKKILAPMVSEFLFYEENKESREDKYSYVNKKIEIRELLKDPENETTLAEILIDLTKDVTGNTRVSLIQLYKELELEKQAYKKLKSLLWYKVAQGIFELSQMKIVESYQIIRHYINDKRSVVRKQAELSTVALRQEGIAYFLDTTKYSISEWQQLKILEELTSMENFMPPRFCNWLTSQNHHVVLFSLRLIKHYDQNDGEKSIITLVNHTNNKIVGEALSCIKKFNFHSSRSVLKNAFWRNNIHSKIAILDTLSSFENKEDITFLKEVERLETNFTVKSKALSAINSILPDHILPTIGLQKNRSKPADFEEDKLEIEKNAPQSMPSQPEVNISNNNHKPKETENSHSAHENTIKFERAKIAITNLKFKFNDIIELLDKPVRFNFKKKINVEPIKDNLEPKNFEEIQDVPNQNETSNYNLKYNSTTSTVSDSMELDTSFHSIFKSLFSYADDYGKMLLLDEILEIGNVKEIAFLTSLHNHHNVDIKNKALIIKTQLQEKLNTSESMDNEASNIIVEEPIREQTTVTEISSKKETLFPGLLEIQEEKTTSKSLKSMTNHFSFLLDEFEIEPANSFDIFDVEFELDFCELNNSETAYLEAMKQNDAVALSNKENDSFHKLISFPLFKKNDLNG